MRAILEQPATTSEAAKGVAEEGPTRAGQVGLVEPEAHKAAVVGVAAAVQAVEEPAEPEATATSEFCHTDNKLVGSWDLLLGVCAMTKQLVEEINQMAADVRWKYVHKHTLDDEILRHLQNAIETLRGRAEIEAHERSEDTF